MQNNGASPDDCASTDRHSFEHRGVEAEPDIVFDDDRFRSDMLGFQMPTDPAKLLEAGVPFAGRERVRVIVENLNSMRHEDTITDCDVIHRPDFAARTHITPVADRNVTLGSKHLKFTHHQTRLADSNGPGPNRVEDHGLGSEGHIGGDRASPAHSDGANLLPQPPWKSKNPAE